MKYRPLSINTLPRVFVNLLAQEDEGIVIFAESLNDCEEMKTWFELLKRKKIHVDRNREYPDSIAHSRSELAEFFCAVLELSKPTRGMFVKDFERLLNELGQNDFFGTEGQCDPRGDRRDLDPYR